MDIISVFNQFHIVMKLWVILWALALMYWFFEFFFVNRKHSIISNKPSIPIASAHSGYVKIEGEISSDDALATPFQDKSCCFWVAKVTGHWTEKFESIDADGDRTTTTKRYSEDVYTGWSGNDFLAISDHSGTIFFDTDGKIENIANYSERYSKLPDVFKQIIGDADYNKYDYYEIEEGWLNYGAPATALGLLKSFTDDEENQRYLILTHPKLSKQPFLLSAMSSAELNKVNKSEVEGVLFGMALAIFFLVDAFYLDGLVITSIINAIVWVVSGVFSFLQNLFS